MIDAYVKIVGKGKFHYAGIPLCIHYAGFSTFSFPLIFPTKIAQILPGDFLRSSFKLDENVRVRIFQETSYFQAPIYGLKAFRFLTYV